MAVWQEVIADGEPLISLSFLGLYFICHGLSWFHYEEHCYVVQSRWMGKWLCHDSVRPSYTLLGCVRVECSRSHSFHRLWAVIVSFRNHNLPPSYWRESIARTYDLYWNRVQWYDEPVYDCCRSRMDHRPTWTCSLFFGRGPALRLRFRWVFLGGVQDTRWYFWATAWCFLSPHLLFLFCWTGDCIWVSVTDAGTWIVG